MAQWQSAGLEIQRILASYSSVGHKNSHRSIYNSTTTNHSAPQLYA